MYAGLREPATLRRAASLAVCLTSSLGLGACGSTHHGVAATTPQPATATAPPAVATTPTATAASTTATTPSTSATTPALSNGSGGTTAPAAGAPGSQRCGSETFTTGASSQGAFDIQAQGTTCAQAHSVARAAKACQGCNYVAGGFHCQGTSGGSGLSRTTYACTQAGRHITFTRAY